MWCCKNDGSSRLCPVSFGFAFGMAAALAVFISGLSGMFYGMPVLPFGMTEVAMSWTTLMMVCFVMFIKVSVFGVVVGLFYNYFSCCCRNMCRKNSDKSEKV